MSEVLVSATTSWPEVVVSDVSELIRGVTYSKDHATDKPQDGYTPVLRATNIQESRLVLDSDLVFVPDDNVSENQRLRAGDIVVATSSGSKHLVGKSGLVHADWRGSFGAFCAAIRPKSNIEPRYLAAFLQSPSYWKQVGKKALGVNINNLRRGDIESLTLPLPPLVKQREIVAELENQFSRLDEAVANLQRVKANLKRYKASVRKAAVEGRLVETEASLARREGRTYETGEQLLQRILGDKKTGWDGRGRFKLPVSPETAELSEVPEGWSWASIDQLAAPGSRSITDGPFGSNLKSAHYVEAGPRVIRLQNIKDGEFEDAYAHITQEHFESLLKHEIFAGDLVIASLGENPPRACIIPASVGPAIVKADCIRFKPHAALKLGYLNAALNCQPTRTRVKDVLHGIGRPRLSLGEIRAIALPIPPAAEQARIVAEVDRHLSIIREVETEVDANLQRARTLRQSVLTKAFSGELSFGSPQPMGSTALEARPSKPLESATVVMAARIIAAHSHEPTFGRVRLQKQLHLATYIAQVATNDEYARKQAGPLDMTMLSGVTKRVNDLGWFRETERADKLHGGKAYGYSALTKADEYKQHLNALTPTQQKVIDELIRLMRNWTTEQCELFSTVYAAWNDLILWNRPPTEQAVIDQVHNHWHESKKKFSAEKIAEMMQKIKDWGYTPLGFGRPTFGQAADTVSGDLFPSQAD